MKKFVSTFKNENEKYINTKLINREYEDDLVDFVVEIFKSLETVRVITFLDYVVEYDESKINFNKYITSRKKKKKKDAHIKYHYIKADRCFELTMRFRIDVKGESKTITKSILLPKKDKNNYYTIKNKKYFLLYQLLDNSTYVSKGGLTLKSLMPTVINRKQETLESTDGVKYTVAKYYLFAFKREIAVLMFYFSRLGFAETLRYFTLDRITQLYDSEQKSDEYVVCIQLNKYIWITVNRHFFTESNYVKSAIAMIRDTMGAKTSIKDLEDSHYWTERVGGLFTTTPHKMYDSGRSAQIFFERLIDLTTKKILKISKVNKLTAYSVVKWIIQNFPELKMKNNLDLSTKRLRGVECIPAMLTKRVSEGIGRILMAGNRVTMKIVLNAFKFPGTIVINLLQGSQLLKFDDRVNDLDIFSALRYTIKGPNSLGEKSDKNINIKYRGIHPSYLGKVDINVYSSSSPGLSGCCSPFVETSGLYFDDKLEPQTTEFDIMKKAMDDKRNKGFCVVDLGDTPVDYYEAKLRMLERERDTFNMHYLVDENDHKLYVILGSDEESLLI